VRRLPPLIPLPLLLGFAIPSMSQPVPLVHALDGEFYGSSLWTDPLWEVCTYDATLHEDGNQTTRTLLLCTKPVVLTTEFYTEADYPTAQKPLLPALKQVAVCQAAGPMLPDNQTSVSFTALLEPHRTLRLTTTHIGARGITSKDFLPALRRPLQIYSSPRDGEGAGERLLTLPQITLFEEQLPVVLRALKFEHDLQATFHLLPPQTTDSAPEPRPSPARLTVEEAPAAWVVLVEAQDRRLIRFEFSSLPPHLLRSVDHSDGWRWQIRSCERRATWARPKDP